MNRTIILSAAAFCLYALPLRADEPTSLPADLAAVPPNAMGFLHVKVADLWKSDFLKDFRALSYGSSSLKKRRAFA